MDDFNAKIYAVYFNSNRISSVLQYLNLIVMSVSLDQKTKHMDVFATSEDLVSALIT